MTSMSSCLNLASSIPPVANRSTASGTPSPQESPTSTVSSPTRAGVPSPQPTSATSRSTSVRAMPTLV
jgi:hypothetical protein